MKKLCPIRGEYFVVDQEDRALLDKLSVKIGETVFSLPDPSQSPDVRKRLKLLWRNEHHLYHTECGLSGKKIISRISPELGVPIYANASRSSDAWECTDFGIDRDADGAVFEKLQRLAWSVPYQDLIGSLTNTTTNALYTNYTADIADSYMVFDAHTVNNCYYLTKARRCEDCIDGHGLMDCRRCYECLDAQSLTTCGRAQHCSHCYDCWWMIDCHNCDSCIGCVGLSHQQYCIFNKQYTKEQFELFREQCIAAGRDIGSCEERQVLIQDLPDLSETIVNSSNIHQSTDIEGSQDLRRCSEMSEAQDCFDVCSYGHQSFLMANSAQVGRFSHHIWMCSTVGKSEHLLYCIDTKKCSHCFGCVNMKGKQYCIFNKQYTKEQYERIVPKLISQMIADGTWGQRLPSTHCLFPYNDSKAQEVYPVRLVVDGNGSVLEENPEGVGTVTVASPELFISKAVLDLGGEKTVPILWRTRVSEVNIPTGVTTVAAADLPLSSDDDLAGTVVLCAETGRPYRLTKGECRLYDVLRLPPPRLHWEERIRCRIAKRR